VARTRSTAELREIAEVGAAELGDASADEIVEWVARNFDVPTVAVACSMADAVLPHLVSQRLRGVDVLFLETGYHFLETKITRDEVARALDVNVVDIHPAQTVPEQDAEYGAELFRRNPELCCALRKVEPLNRALAGYEVWFTGVRREEAPTRTGTQLIAWDEAHGLVKVNPLAAWTFDEVTGYASENKVPQNLLLSNGYPSIGCEPCTKPVAPGADPRSGRWAGSAKTECGIHVTA
jgi:phosphoadenosine phosphosulfate reductase